MKPDRKLGSAKTPFAYLLTRKTAARVAPPPARSTAAPVAPKPKAQRPDHEEPTSATPFAHLRARGHLLAAFTPAPPAGAAPRLPRAAEDPAQDRADFIIRAGQIARGEIAIPRSTPQSRPERDAQAGADFIMNAAAKAWPDRHGGAK